MAQGNALYVRAIWRLSNPGDGDKFWKGWLDWKKEWRARNYQNADGFDDDFVNTNDLYTLPSTIIGDSYSEAFRSRSRSTESLLTD